MAEGAAEVCWVLILLLQKAPVVFMLLIRVVEYETKPIPDRQPFVPLLRTGDGGRKGEPDLGSQRINGTLVSFSLSWRARKLHLRPLPCI